MSRTPRTLARLERILTMVPWLLEHPGVTLDEVATRFATTPEEVAGDLDVLGYCGLPGYGGGDLIEATIVGDRVSVRMAEFFSRPLRLSIREAVTLLLAGRALAGVDGLPESTPLASAVRKLEDALQGASGQALAPVRMALDLRAPGDELLGPLRGAVAAGHVVRLTYRSASKAQTTQRDVEPWAVLGAGGAWYLQGFCRLAQAPRDFRLDRVRELEVTDERVDAPRDATRPPVYEPAPGDAEVVLDLAPRARWVAEWAVVDRVEERGEALRVTLRTSDLGWVARLVLRLGADAEVVAPHDLAGQVRSIAAASLARYRGHR